MRKRSPIKLLDYGGQWKTKVMQRTSTQEGESRVTFPLHGGTGKKPNISECLYFDFYYYVSYKYNDGLGMTDIGRWLGISHRVGGLMSYWILTQKRTVISRPTFQHITNLEKETYGSKASVKEFNTEISRCFKKKEDLIYDGS